MDLKVYKKETVTYQSGSESIYVPDVIDIYPDIETDSEGNEILKGAEVLSENSDELEQATALASIWQKGLDPLDTDSGNRWSELFLGEINVLQIMEDITQSVTDVAPSVSVDFSTVTDANGKSYFTYKIKVVS